MILAYNYIVHKDDFDDSVNSNLKVDFISPLRFMSKK